MSLPRIMDLFPLLALLAAGTAAAKSAEDYLHGGAARYIQGRLQEASVEVEDGLRRYPDDARLKALAAQLKNMKDQQKKDQGGGEGQGGSGSEEKRDRPDSSQGNGQGKRPEDQAKEQGKDKPEEQGKDGQGADPEKEKEQEKAGGDESKPPQAEEGKDGDSTGNGAAPVPPGQMSKEEAERLLNSYQDDEKREQKNLQRRYRKPVEAEQDW